MMTDKSRDIIAVQTLRNAIMTASFFATSASFIGFWSLDHAVDNIQVMSTYNTEFPFIHLLDSSQMFLIGWACSCIIGHSKSTLKLIFKQDGWTLQLVQHTVLGGAFVLAFINMM